MRTTFQNCFLFTFLSCEIQVKAGKREDRRLQNFKHARETLNFAIKGPVMSLGVQARSAETLLYLLGFLLLLFPRTDRAAQTVRPRELKLCQMVVVRPFCQTQRFVPIGL